MNYFWQFIFFFSVFILAFVSLFETLAVNGIIEESQGEDIVEFINTWFTMLFGVLIPFAFPLMMWSGIVRGKWEGKFRLMYPHLAEIDVHHCLL